MMVLTEKCPRCGNVSSWSPLRVWCGHCSFQMAGLPGESQGELIDRWNAAVRDGVGYVELVRENNAREAAKADLQMSCLQRGKGMGE